MSAPPTERWRVRDTPVSLVISSAIAVAIGSNLGCVVESSGVNKSSDEVKKGVKDMVKYMMDKRDENINELILKRLITLLKR